MPLRHPPEQSSRDTARQRNRRFRQWRLVPKIKSQRRWLEKYVYLTVACHKRVKCFGGWFGSLNSSGALHCPVNNAHVSRVFHTPISVRVATRTYYCSERAMYWFYWFFPKHWNCRIKGEGSAVDAKGLLVFWGGGESSGKIGIKIFVLALTMISFFFLLGIFV